MLIPLAASITARPTSTPPMTSARSRPSASASSPRRWASPMAAAFAAMDGARSDPRASSFTRPRIASPVAKIPELSAQQARQRGCQVPVPGGGAPVRKAEDTLMDLLVMPGAG